MKNIRLTIIAMLTLVVTHANAQNRSQLVNPTNQFAPTGYAGIGQPSPKFPLTFKDSLGDKISLWGNVPDGNHYGFGIQYALLQIYSSASIADIGFGWGKSSAFNEKMRIKGNGNVGIGTISPAQKLSVVSNDDVDATNIAAFFSKNGTQGIGIAYNSLRTIGSGANGNMNFYSKGTGYFSFYTNATEKIRIDNAGNVGIGTTSPAFPLNFANSLGDKISLYGNSGAHYGFGIQSHLLQIQSDASISDIAFGYGSSSAFTEIMRIKGNGNVGIGTATPGEKLEIQGSDATVRIKNVNDEIGSFIRDTYHSMQLGLYNPAANTSRSYFGFDNNGKVGSLTNNNVGSPAFRNILDDGFGNVGIGTVTPLRKFQVQDGDVRITEKDSGTRYLEFVSTASNQNDVRLEYSKGSSLYFSSSFDNFGSFFDLARFDLKQFPAHVFTIYGSAYASGGTWDNSDAKLKKNVIEFNGAMDIIKQLKPRTYFFKTDEYKRLNLPRSKQYGFIAQDLEKILPELVKTSQQSVGLNANDEHQTEEIKTVNYTELIPILTKAIQEQQQQIEELKQLVQKLAQQSPLSNTVNDASTKTTVSLSNNKLEQNIPNPLTNTTSIHYATPVNAKKVQLLITNNSGRMVKQLALNPGNGVVNMDASGLSSGTYSYALVVDGRTIESKKMVVAH